MSEVREHPEWLNVPAMVADLGGCVSPVQVRKWCRLGAVDGAINKGDKRECWIVPREAWERFKESRRPKVNPRAIARAAALPGIPRAMRYVKTMEAAR
jgi:hypothetical protein